MYVCVVFMDVWVCVPGCLLLEILDSNPLIFYLLQDLGEKKERKKEE